MSAESLLRAEADVYRKALVGLYCDATSGKRTTLDKAQVAKAAGCAIDHGNELFRRAKSAA